MNITTKGHVETISNDGTMANSWSGNWDSTTQSGDLATIKNTNGVVIEDYRPIENPNELRDYITPRRTMYFGYRAMPRRQEDPVVYDDSKEGGLIKKLESLLDKDPKVLVFKPQRNRSRSTSTSASSTSASTSSPRSTSASRSRSTSTSTKVKRKSPIKPKKKVPAKGKKKSPGKTKAKVIVYNTPKRRTKTNVTRKKGKTKAKSTPIFKTPIMKTLMGTTK